VEVAADTLAHRWFSDPDIKRKVAGALREAELDESAVEAEAIRKSAADLERIDRLLASAEARRDKALLSVARYRSDLSVMLRDTSNRMIDSKVLQLETVVNEGQKPAA
jgi:hypothetical protein